MGASWGRAARAGSPKLPHCLAPRAESRGAAWPRARRAAPRRVQPVAGELCFNSSFNFPPLPSHQAPVALQVGCSLRWCVTASSFCWAWTSGSLFPLSGGRTRGFRSPLWPRSLSCVRFGLKGCVHAWTLQTDLKKLSGVSCLAKPCRAAATSSGCLCIAWGSLRALK